ncbi:MAG TPA: hypothetical protein VKD70_02875 [Candidatus Acidoferrum sp.]|nr:hypothetical protein [Candidatus Acidoferrum sp.]
MLDLRIVRSPLLDSENRQILAEYNRLTGARIPLNEFEHWVQNSPAGPAWHAILETAGGRIVGHTSLIPLRASGAAPGMIPAKSEFSFVHENFRSAPISGFEKGRIKFLVIVNELFSHCIKEGWGPYFVSTAEANHPLSRRVGCKNAEFPLTECLLIRNVLGAARETPNLSAKRRAGLFGAGLVHKLAWAGNRIFANGNGKIRPIRVSSDPVAPVTDRLSFFEDADSLRWRYFEDQYLRFAFEDSPEDYVIVKRGEADRFVRVVQWRIRLADHAGALIGKLIRQAEADKALGIRWAVYHSDPLAKMLIGMLRLRGFLCVPRTRTLMLHSRKPEYTEASAWNVNDSLVSFDP